MSKYNPSHKKVNLAGKIVKLKEPDKYGNDVLKPKLNSPQLMQFFLRTHAKPGDWFSLQLVLKRPKRSESQNNFFFLYLDLISLSCGHTVYELHRWVKDKILGEGITEVFGEEVRMVGETSDLNISEFCEMMNRVHEKTGVPIPDPEPFKLPLTYDEYGKLKIEQNIKYSKMKNRLTGANIN